MLLRAIASTANLVLFLNSLSIWYYDVKDSWEEANKPLTNGERLFLHFGDFCVKYWYLFAFAWFVSSLMGWVVCSREDRYRQDNWV